MFFSKLFIIFCILQINLSINRDHVVEAQSQGLQMLSYPNADIVPAQRPTSTSTTTTELPLEEPTTKKLGFFSGFKKLFKKASTTEEPPVSTTTTTTTTTTPRTTTKSNIPVSTPAVVVTPKVPPRDFSAYPQSSTSTRPSSSLPTPSTVRDYQRPTPAAVLPQQPTPSTVRDYQRPTPAAVTPQQPTPSTVRDYQRPTPSTIRDYQRPTPTPTPASPALPPKSPVRDYPPLPPRPSTTPSSPQPAPAKDEFPALPGRRPSNDNYPALPVRPGQQPVPVSPTPASAWTPTTANAWSTVARPGATTPRPGMVNFVPKPAQPAVPNVSGSTTSATPEIATDNEITTLTEQLFNKETNNPFKYVTVNYQGRTYSSGTNDEATKPLLEVSDEAYQLATVSALRPLFNNYELDTLVNEYVTPIERKEENEFVDAVMATSLMRHAMLFLQQKGLVSPDPKTHRDLLKTIWFTLYSRGQGKIGSSAFEHIFLTEIKNGTISGLHNWVYFHEEEKAGRADYKGYIKKVELGNKGAVLKLRFSFDNYNKPVNSMFVGTSPELELALYTLCFQLRPDKDCPISLGGKTFNIKTHTFRYRGKNLIGSAFPEI